MAIAPIAPASTAAPTQELGYLETALQWLMEKVNAVVRWIFSCFCPPKAPDLPAPVGVPAAPPPPPPPAPVPFESLPEAEQQNRCRLALHALQGGASQLKALYELVGKAVYQRKVFSWNWLRSYETLGKRAVEKDPLLFYKHASNLLLPVSSPSSR